jgi:drug/metabolite transporter (DMT)-like permease
VAFGLVIIFSLIAGLSWGISDFSGGVATKKISVYAVLFLSQIIGTIALLVIIFFSGEHFSSSDLGWAILGGIFGAIGLLALYRGLAVGIMSIVAPMSALISTCIPVVFSLITEGYPSNIQIFGFILAILSIVLVSISLNDNQNSVFTINTTTNLLYGLLAGFGFGMFFIMVDQFESGAVFWPLTILRFSSITFVLFVIVLMKPQVQITQQRMLIINNWKIIIIAGMGDTFGNVFFTLASQNGRLDIAAIISSLFPLVTIFLAWFIYREKILSHQKFGIAGALFAVVLLSI